MSSRKMLFAPGDFLGFMLLMTSLNLTYMNEKDIQTLFQENLQLGRTTTQESDEMILPAVQDALAARENVEITSSFQSNLKGVLDWVV